MSGSDLFAFGAGIVLPNESRIAYKVSVEFTPGLWTDITGNVLRFHVDRYLATLFHPLTASSAMIEVSNATGQYSSANSASSYYPNLLPGKRVHIVAYYSPNSGSWDQEIFTINSYGMFSGYITQYQVNPSPTTQSVLVTGTDIVQRLGNVTITTSLHTNINPATLFTEVMSECAVNSFTPGVIDDVIQFAWFQDLQARTALERIIQFGKYYMYQDGWGTFQLKPRYYYGVTSVITVANNFTELTYTLDDSQVLNDIKIIAQPRRVDTSVNTVAWLQEIISVAASSSTGFWTSYVDPVETSVYTPAVSLSCVNSADYLCNTQSDGAGSDRTATLSLSATFFGEAAVCSLFNGSSDTVYLTKFQIRGYSARRQPAISYRTKSTSSQALYGKHEYALVDEFMSRRDFVKDYAESVKVDFEYPAPAVRARFVNLFPSSADDKWMADIEPGSVISLVHSISAINSSWLVMRVGHDVSFGSGGRHECVVDVEHYGGQRGSYLILDNPTFGLLNTGALGF